MSTEIERKFLVTGDAWKQATPVLYCQGYLNRDRGRTVRVRIAGDEAWLTVKGPSEGISRAEFEYSIPVNEAKEMLKLCDGPLIEKNRRIVVFEGHQWEVDEFLGDNEGLVIAEIELQSEDEEFATPEWLGEEVSDDPRYFNSRLSISPYRTWDE